MPISAAELALPTETVPPAFPALIFLDQLATTSAHAFWGNTSILPTLPTLLVAHVLQAVHPASLPLSVSPAMLHTPS